MAGQMTFKAAFLLADPNCDVQVLDPSHVPFAHHGKCASLSTAPDPTAYCKHPTNTRSSIILAYPRHTKGRQGRHQSWGFGRESKGSERQTLVSISKAIIWCGLKTPLACPFSFTLNLIRYYMFADHSIPVVIGTFKLH